MPLKVPIGFKNARPSWTTESQSHQPQQTESEAYEHTSPTDCRHAFKTRPNHLSHPVGVSMSSCPVRTTGERCRRTAHIDISGHPGPASGRTGGTYRKLSSSSLIPSHARHLSTCRTQPVEHPPRLSRHDGYPRSLRMVRRYIFKLPPAPLPNLSGEVRSLKDLNASDREAWIRQAYASRRGRDGRTQQREWTCRDTK